VLVAHVATNTERPSTASKRTWMTSSAIFFLLIADLPRHRGIAARFDGRRTVTLPPSNEIGGATGLTFFAASEAARR
jgi:hypothetical protein